MKANKIYMVEGRKIVVLKEHGYDVVNIDGKNYVKHTACYQGDETIEYTLIANIKTSIYEWLGY